MEAVYAFCRAVDDVVDQEETASSVQRPASSCRGIAQRELDLWRSQLKACRNGFPTHPIAVALQEVAQRYEIPMEHFEAILSGVEMDLTKKRYTNFEELQSYCERVASAVGLISIRIFGCRHPAAEQYAHHLGMALQLTNILRDLRTDYARGRVYLPQDELRQFRFSEEGLHNGAASSPEFQALMAFQARRAEDFFRQAAAACRDSREGRLLLPARIMGGVYRRLLSRIGKLRYDVFSQRISVPSSEQFLIALRCLVSSS